MAVKTPPIIILDFETGGFSSRENAVTEFAGIGINGETFEEIARYEAIVAPYSDDLLYNPDALKATNISMNQINSGVEFKKFSRDLLSFFRKCAIHSHIKYRPIIAGHNVTFDISFLQQIFFHTGKQIDKYLNCNKDHHGNQQPKYFDTQILAMTAWGNDEAMTKHTLTDCVNKIGEEIVNAHRAMNDVEATKSLLVNFLKRLRGSQTVDGDFVTNDESVSFRDKFKFLT